MAANEIHVGDVGTLFSITVQDGDVVVDLTGASVADIIFKKPSETKVTKSLPATVIPIPTNGIIQYTTVSGDLDEAGTWQIQVRITIPGFSGYSDIGCFEVFENL